MGPTNLNFPFNNVESIHSIRLQMGIYSQYYAEDTLLQFKNYTEALCVESGGCFDAISETSFYNYTSYGGSELVEFTEFGPTDNSTTVSSSTESTEFGPTDNPTTASSSTESTETVTIGDQTTVSLFVPVSLFSIVSSIIVLTITRRKYPN